MRAVKGMERLIFQKNKTNKSPAPYIVSLPFMSDSNPAATIDSFKADNSPRPKYSEKGFQLHRGNRQQGGSMSLILSLGQL